MPWKPQPAEDPRWYVDESDKTAAIRQINNVGGILGINMGFVKLLLVTDGLTA